jgi:hypothetical protein
MNRQMLVLITVGLAVPAGILTLRYRTYEELCRQLYFKIPLFLSRHQLGR